MPRDTVADLGKALRGLQGRSSAASPEPGETSSGLLVSLFRLLGGISQPFGSVLGRCAPQVGSCLPSPPRLGGGGESLGPSWSSLALSSKPFRPTRNPLGCPLRDLLGRLTTKRPSRSMQALPTFTPHFQIKLPGGTRRRADTIITTVRPAAAMMSTEHGVTNSTSPHHLEPAWLCSRYHHLHHRVPAVRSARLHSSPTFPPAITSTIQIVALRPPPRPPPTAMPWRRSTSAARRPRVSPSLFYNAGTTACEKGVCIKWPPGPPGAP